MDDALSGSLADTLAAGRWSLTNTIAQKVLTFGTFFILARLLVPADFGVVALLAVVPNFIEGVTSLAFDMALVQRRGDVGPYLNVIWTFTVLRGIALFLFVFFTAPYIAHFFHIEYAVTALRFAGIGSLLQGFMNIGQTYFFIDLNLKPIFLRDLTLRITYAVSTIVLALIFHSYWAPFIGNFISIFAVVIATYVLHPYRPSLDMRLGKLKDLFPFTRWLLGQELLNQLVRTLEDSLIGRFATPAALGIYGKSKALASAPTSPLISLINKVSFTSYARAQESMAHVREGVHKTFDVMLAIALPYLIVLMVAGNRLVLIFLGPNWIVITPYLKLLALAATLDMLFVSIATPVFNAIGQPKTQFFINSVAASTVLAGLIVLVPRYGIWGATFATLLGTSLAACVTLYLMYSRLHLAVGRIVRGIAVVGVACAVPMLLSSLLLPIPFFNHTFPYLGLVGASGALYLLLLIGAGTVLHVGPYATLLVIAHSLFQTRLARSLRLPALARGILSIGVDGIARMQHFTFPRKFTWKWKWEMLAGAYEPETTRYMRRALRPGMVILDIGAHIGYFTRLFARRAGTRGAVYAFEADAENALLLERNVAGRPTVSVVRKAIAAQSGTVSFYHLAHSTGCHSMVSPAGTAVASQVPAVSVDDFVTAQNLSHVDFIKMDIEGGEPLALAGMTATLAANPHLLLVTEYNPESLAQGGSAPESYLQDLEGHGLHLYAITATGLVPFTASDAQRLAAYFKKGSLNILCTKTNPA